MLNNLYVCPNCNESYLKTLSGLFNRSLSTSTYVCTKKSDQKKSCPSCDPNGVWIPSWAVGLDD